MVFLANQTRSINKGIKKNFSWKISSTLTFNNNYRLEHKASKNKL